MQIRSGKHTYQWIDNWARIPDTSSGRENGRTHGVCVARDGSVIVFHQAHEAVLRFDPDGKLISSWGGGGFPNLVQHLAAPSSPPWLHAGGSLAGRGITAAYLHPSSRPAGASHRNSPSALQWRPEASAVVDQNVPASGRIMGNKLLRHHRCTIS